MIWILYAIAVAAVVWCGHRMWIARCYATGLLAFEMSRANVHLSPKERRAYDRFANWMGNPDSLRSGYHRAKLAQYRIRLKTEDK